MDKRSKILPILKNADINDFYAEKCKRSFYFFVQFFWETIIAEKPIWNWHIKYLCDELQQVGQRVAQRLPKEYDYLIINVPPGSSKSTIVSEMYPLWCWVIDPTQRFICGSYASTPAEDMAEKCYNIYHSDKFKKTFPALVAKTNGGKTHFKNGLRGERYTTSTGSAITGIHAHQIILDDPMNPEIASSDKLRATANTWLSETISNRKVDQNIAITILVMQRLHMSDSTGYVLNLGLRVKHICIPAELSQDVKPKELQQYYIDGLFDPIRKSRTILEASKKEYGSYGYAGQMMQRPSPLDGGILKKNWFNIIKKAELPPNAVINFQLDPAYTAKQTNDPTGAIAYIVHNGNVYVLNSQSVWKEFPDLCKWLIDWVKQYGYTNQSRIRVEPKASGKSIVQQIKQTTGLNIIEDESPKDDKVTRVNAVSPKIEAGRIYLVEGHWNEAFLNQCAVFPNGDHDDELDCLTAIINRELNTPKLEWLII